MQAKIHTQNEIILIKKESKQEKCVCFRQVTQPEVSKCVVPGCAAVCMRSAVTGGVILRLNTSTVHSGSLKRLLSISDNECTSFSKCLHLESLLQPLKVIML